MAKPWLFDELASAGREHLDPGFVAGFDRKQGRPDPAEDLAVFAKYGAESSSTLVDLGAGTGQFALAAAHRFQRVVAVDVSPVMLSHLRARAAELGLPGLECVRAGFLSYEHVGAPVDGVYSRNALHQLPDFWKGIALERIARMLRPGGILRLRDLIYDFQPSEADAVLDRWLEGSADDPSQGYTREDYAEHIRSEHSTFRWLLEPMLAATGFRIVAADFRRSVYGAYTCIKQ